MLNGKLTHRRTINSKYGTSDIHWLRQKIDTSAERFEGKPKLKYLLPLDKQTAEHVKALSKPFSNAPQAETSAAPVWRGRGSTERGASDHQHQLN